jgi:hypothetical protein
LFLLRDTRKHFSPLTGIVVFKKVVNSVENYVNSFYNIDTSLLAFLGA